MTWSLGNEKWAKWKHHRRGAAPCWTLPIRRTARFAKRTSRLPSLLCRSCWSEIAPCRSHPQTEDGSRAFEQVVSLGPFTGVLQQAIYALKFRNQVRLGRALGECMGQCLARTARPAGLLVARALAPGSAAGERGFNQSAEIAAGLGAALGVPVCYGVVRRRRNTRQQALLSAEERRANLRGAFCARGCAACKRSDRDSR